MTVAEKPCLDCGTPISVKRTSGRCTICYRKHYRMVKKAERIVVEDTDAASIVTSNAVDPQEEVSKPPEKTCKDCNKKLSPKRKSPRCKECKAIRKERKSKRAKEDAMTTDDERPPPKCSDCNATLAAQSTSKRCQECEEKQISEEEQQPELQVPEEVGQSKSDTEQQSKDDQQSDTEVQPKEDQLSDTEVQLKDDQQSDTEVQLKEDQQSDTEMQLKDDQQSDTEQRSKEDQQSKEEEQSPEAGTQYESEQQVSSENALFHEEAHFAEDRNRQNRLNGHEQERPNTCNDCDSPIPWNFTTGRCLGCEKNYLTEEDSDDNDVNDKSTKGKWPSVCRDCGLDLPLGQSSQCHRCKKRHISKTMPTRPEQRKCSTCGTEIPEDSKSDQCASCHKTEAYMDPQPGQKQQTMDQCDQCGVPIPPKWTNGRCVHCNNNPGQYPSHNGQTTMGCCECDPTIRPDTATPICSNCAAKVIIDEPTPTFVYPVPEEPPPVETKCFDCEKPIAPDATAGRCLSCYRKLMDWQIGLQGHSYPVNGSLTNGVMDSSSAGNSSQQSEHALPKQCVNCSTVILSNTKSDQCQKCSQSQPVQQANSFISQSSLFDGGVLPKCRGCGCPISPIVKNGLCPRCFQNHKTSTQSRRDSLLSSQSDNRQNVTKDPVIAACGLQNESSRCKSLTRTMISGVGLVPLDIHVGDKKVTALVHPDALSHLTGYNGGEQVCFLPCPDYRPLKSDKQRYKYTIDASRYAEIGEEHQELLASSWMNNPRVKYAATDLLSGCLIVCGTQILKVQCLEPYGYVQYIDVHWERFGPVSKKEAGQGSFSDWYGRYTRIAVGNLYDPDGQEMLVIFTPEGTFLVTASTRLDKPNPMCDVGPITHDFKPSRNAKIYLSTKSMATSRVLNNFRLYNNSDLLQLRDVRSKFINKSTYHLCRGTSQAVNWQNLRPVTLWTLADVVNDCDEWEIVNSRIFQTVALSMIHNKSQLHKQDMEALLYGCDEETGRYVKEILSIFKPGLAYIHILKNWELNRILTELAELLGPAIDNANATVRLNMQKFFIKKNNANRSQSRDSQNIDEER